MKTVYRVLALGLLVMLSMATALAVAPASPPDCRANDLEVSIERCSCDAVVGAPLSWTVGVTNIQNGDAIACDVTDLVIDFKTPDGVTYTFGPFDAPNGTEYFVAGSAPYVADTSELEGPNWIGRANWSGTLVDGADSPMDGSKSLPINYVPQDVSVEKTAEPSSLRTIEWTIEKDVSPGEHVFFDGESASSSYTIELVKSDVTGGFAVSGTITIVNPSEFVNATVESVSDSIEGVGPADVTCDETLPYDIGPLGTLSCTYTAALPDDATRTNAVEVVTSGDIGGSIAQATIDFTGVEPVLIGEETVQVEDSIEGSLGTFSSSDTITYDRTFDCEGAEYAGGVAPVMTTENTASIVETGASDSASVDVACFVPIVEKTAATSFTRTYEWMIDKSVDIDSWSFFPGQSGISEYTVAVNRTGFTDTEHAISGEISIENPAPKTAQLTSVFDTLGIVTCPSLDVPAQSMLTCTYAGDGDGSELLNVAEVVLAGETYLASAPIVYDEPTTVFEEVNIEDTNGESWGPVSGETVWTYKRTFDCSDAGSNPNTATIIETGQSDDANVDVVCSELSIDKTGIVDHDVAYEWTIDKTGNVSEITLNVSQAYPVSYDVVLTPTLVLDRYTVSGTITVTNPSEDDVVLESVTDSLADVECPSLTVPAQGSLTCTYEGVVDVDDIENTATARFSGVDYTTTVPLGFSEPNVSDECVLVTDTIEGPLGSVCVGDTDTFEYEQMLSYDLCLESGRYEHENVASFITSDTLTTGEDSWIVYVEVPCLDDGCTLTQGYWKTHSAYGPAPYDETWASIGEETPFYASGLSWYDAFYEKARGNAYYTLAVQYMAAQLNREAGASAPAEVTVAMNDAHDLFMSYAPDEIASLKGGDTVRQEFISLAELLDDYNNGIIGPGHCD